MKQNLREKCWKNKSVEKTNAPANETKSPKVKRLSNYEVSDFIVSKNVKTDTELFAQASIQKEAGKKELANFVMSRSSKASQDLITNSWKMNSVAEELQWHSVPRMETIHQTANTECMQHCEGTWLQSAIEVLTNNQIHHVVFAHSLHKLLEKGRGKFRNMVVGPANCGKTFILMPLTKFLTHFQTLQMANMPGWE